MADPLASLATRLSHARGLSGLSARALGKLAGIHESHVSAIEGGTIGAPGVPTITKLANALGLSVAWLLLGEGKPPTETAVKKAVAQSSSAA